MSELYKKIKADSLDARKATIKDKSPVAKMKSDAFSVLIGAIDRKAKDTGEEITDTKCAKAAQSLLDGVNEILGYANIEAQLAVRSNIEKEIFGAYVPKRLTEVELENLITATMKTLADGGKLDVKPGPKANIMKAIAASHSGLYDGKIAAELISKILS